MIKVAKGADKVIRRNVCTNRQVHAVLGREYFDPTRAGVRATNDAVVRSSIDSIPIVRTDHDTVNVSDSKLVAGGKPRPRAAAIVRLENPGASKCIDVVITLTGSRIDNVRILGVNSQAAYSDIWQQVGQRRPRCSGVSGLPYSTGDSRRVHDAGIGGVDNPRASSSANVARPKLGPRPYCERLGFRRLHWRLRSGPSIKPR